MPRIDFIACPGDWRHPLDRETLVCLEPGCGHEAVAIPPVVALTMMANDNLKPETQNDKPPTE